MAGRYGLQIRRAASGDAPGLSDLLMAAGTTAGAKPLSARIEALDQQPGAILIALEWGPPSGVIVVHWRRTLLDDHPVGSIDFLLVRPEDRRRGLGRLLLKAGAQAARAAGCTALELIASSDEVSLTAFGQAAGFHQIGGRYARSLRKKV